MNELLFIVHAVIIASFALIALMLGQYALIAFISIQSVIANFFILKQISLFGFIATCTDPFTIGATVGLNLLQEFFGKEMARKAIKITIFTSIFCAIVSFIHLCYVPHCDDFTQSHFAAILNPAPRILAASLCSSFVAQYVDYWLYGFLKKISENKYIVACNCISTATSQLLDTALFSFLGLYGIINNMWSIIMVSYCVKLIAIMITIPFVGCASFVYAHTSKHNNISKYHF